jgi:uncharacterized protein YwqG
MARTKTLPASAPPDVRKAHARAVERIKTSTLGRFASRLVPYLRPSLRWVLQPAANDLPIGSSRVGGEPDVPAKFSWPLWTCDDTPRARMWGWKPRKTGPRALDFLAQLRLKDLASIDFEGLLPREGSLLFFYDTHVQPWGGDVVDVLGSRVCWVREDAPLERRKRPPLGKGAPLKPCAVRCRVEWTLPLWIRSVFGRHEPSSADLDKFLQRVNERVRAPIHRVWGHAQHIQDPPEFGTRVKHYAPFRLVGRETRPEDWFLLLQLDSDYWPKVHHGAMWGDLGRLYFLMHRADLKARRFSRAQCTLQCT